MKNLEFLVDKYKETPYINFTTINDLVIKEMEEYKLNKYEIKAVKNYNKSRLKHLESAVNKTAFNRMCFITRLAANVVPYKEFI